MLQEQIDYQQTFQFLGSRTCTHEYDCQRGHKCSNALTTENSLGRQSVKGVCVQSRFTYI